MRRRAGGGILRRRGGAAGGGNAGDDSEDAAKLLVFGYSCKLFRDDERALHVDLGRHLIPCMADDSVLIDRYDARGALGPKELAAAESRGDPFGRDRLTAEERRAETLCDEERYRALRFDEEEQETCREEELKKLQSSRYGRVEFNYESDGVDDSREAPSKGDEANEDDEPFTVPPTLGAPEGMPLPDTKKLNVIIEKTAFFIASQGTQMEILLKAKQSGNPQFEFLSLECPLHAYYCFLLSAIKEGRYKNEELKEKEDKNEEDDHYLHPSLAPMTVESAPSIPSIAYKPSADCAYSMLVNEIKGTSETENQEKTNSENPPSSVELAPPGTEPVPQINEEQYYNQGMHPEYLQMYAHHPYYSSYNSNYNFTEISKAPILYNTIDEMGAIHQNPYEMLPSGSENINHKLKLNENNSSTNSPNLEKSNAIGLKLIHYSDSEDDDDNDSTESNQSNTQLVKIPPANQQSIIDKMASYVARNGNDFEQIVKMKGDPRFSFLDENHEFNPYYKHKRRFYEASKKNNKFASPEDSEDVTLKDAEGSENSASEDSKKIIAPVSFSIKKMKEAEPVLPKPALPYESSEEDGDNDNTELQEKPADISEQQIPKIEDTPEPSVPVMEVKLMLPIEQPKLELRPKLFNQYIYQIQPVLQEQNIGNTQNNSTSSSSNKSKESDRHDSRPKSPLNSEREEYRRKKKRKRHRSEGEDHPSDVITIDEELDSKNMAQFIDLTDECQDEGTNNDSKNNHIQLERKRKAAAFLSSLKAVPAAPVGQHNTLASAMVKTLHTLQNKEEDSSSIKRRKREENDSRNHKQRKTYDYYSNSDSRRHSSRDSYRSRMDHDKHNKKSKRKKSSRDRSPDYHRHLQKRSSTKYSSRISPKANVRRSKSHEKSPTEEYTKLRDSLEYRKAQKQDELLTASLKELVRETRKDFIQAQPIKMAVDIFSNDTTAALKLRVGSDDEWEKDSNDGKEKLNASMNSSNSPKTSPET